MSEPLIHTIPVGPLQCNCSILVDEETREGVVIDPGDEPARILRELERLNVRPVALLHTHAHFDHITGTSEVARVSRAPIRLHPADRPLYDALPEQAAMFGLTAATPTPPAAALADGDVVAFGRHALRVVHTPGHTPGSSCFVLDGSRAILFSGDTLFRRSIGRTDLWGGDTRKILSSIRRRLFTLEEHTRVVCGHGPDTTIGEKKKLNPFAAP